MQDGKVQELKDHEKREGQRKMLQKKKGNRGKINEDEGEIPTHFEENLKEQEESIESKED